MISLEQLNAFLHDLTDLSRQHGLILSASGYILAVTDLTDEPERAEGEYVYNEEDRGFLWRT